MDMCDPLDDPIRADPTRLLPILGPWIKPLSACFA
jgi:hypothetical protein